MSEARGAGTGQAGGRLAAHAAMLLFSALVSSSFSVGAVITGAMDPAALTFLRVLLAALFFGIAVLASGRARWPSWRESWQSVVLGGLVVTFFVAMFESLRLTTALNTGALFCTIPLMTAAISFIGLGQRLNARQLVSLLLASAGAIWVVFGGDLGNLVAFRLGPGEIIFLVGCVSYSAYSPAIRWFDAGAPALLVSFWTVLAGAVCLAIYGYRPIMATGWSEVQPVIYLAIAYLALFTTAITFFLIQFASTRLPQARVMAYIFLVPAFIVLTEGVVHGHWPTPSVLAGVGVIAAAMLVLQVDRSDSVRAAAATHRG